jgi:hypothetical protein
VFTHDQQADVDRHAVHDALVTHGLLTMLPRRARHGALKPSSTQNGTAMRGAGILDP